MDECEQFRCVNCGEPSGALYRTYGPSVLKLNKCDNCNEIVDKYIEYDPVIVMIDLVLMSKEAQRHVLFNTEFKSYWKLFIILMLLETYGVWRNDCLFSVVVKSLCGIPSGSADNSTYISFPIAISMPESWKSQCSGWVPEQKGDESDLFIWEKDFYIQFLSTFSGIVAFIMTIHSSMRIMKTFTRQNEVCMRRVVKAFSLGNMSLLFSLPVLVWGSEARAETHYLLVFGYSFVVFVIVLTVLYECPKWAAVCAVGAGCAAKGLATFHAAPRLRALLA